MAALDGLGLPRRRVATYGKPSTRRLPDYTGSMNSETAATKTTSPFRISPTPELSRLKSPARRTSSSPKRVMADDVFAVPSSDEDVAVETKTKRTNRKRSSPRKKQLDARKTGVGAMRSNEYIPIANKADNDSKRRRVAITPAVPRPPTGTDALQPDNHMIQRHVAFEGSPVCSISSNITEIKHGLSPASSMQLSKQPQIIQKSMSELPDPLRAVALANKSSTSLAGRGTNGACSSTNRRALPRGAAERSSSQPTPVDDGTATPLRGNLPRFVNSHPNLGVTRPAVASIPVKRKHSSTSPSPPGDMAFQCSVVEQLPHVLTPRSEGLWHNLLEAEKTAGEHGLIYGNRSTKQGDWRDCSEQRAITKVRAKEAAGPMMSSDTRLQPRRRLIDSLVEQASQVVDGDLHSDISDDSSLSNGNSSNVTPMQVARVTTICVPTAEGEPHVVTKTFSRLPSFQESSTSQGSQNVGPKITYLRPNRTVVQEASFESQLVSGTPLQPPNDGMLPAWRKSKTNLSSTSENHSKSTDANVHDEATGQTIRSIHELRQGGANKRFLGSVEALLDDIGTPTVPVSSRRRSALLDLASKATEKGFCRQFLDNGLNHKLVLRIGQEMDVISGFAIVSFLNALLAEGAALHTIAQVRDEGINDLLGRMLESTDTIRAIVKQRKTNMSKVAQSLVLDYEGMLLSTTTWAGVQVEELSPQMTALKCLETVILRAREAGSREDVLSEELTQKLFNILKMALQNGWWDAVVGCNTTTIRLVLSTLESHSVYTKDIGTRSTWTTEYLPVMANTLTKALSRPYLDFGMSQTLALRWTLNMTVHCSEASQAFASSKLMVALGRVIVEGFELISGFLLENHRQPVLDNLVLTLAVMINLAECSVAACNCMQGLHGSSHDPLEGMLQIFTERQESIAEVSRPIYCAFPMQYSVIILGPIV